MPDWQPDGADLTSGAAGVGIGHLMLGDITGDPLHRAAARRCAEYLLERQEDGQLSADSDEPRPLLEREAVEPATGRAHGLAGYVDLLLHAAGRLDHKESLVGAAEQVSHLAERAESLAERVPTRFSAPIAASWCQGLAGIAPVLLHAGDVLHDHALGVLARRLADVCLDFLPHVSVPVQCCGLVGIGNLFIDLAVHDSSGQYWAAAHATARQLLIRSTGPVNHPSSSRTASRNTARHGRSALPDSSPSSAGWRATVVPAASPCPEFQLGGRVRRNSRRPIGQGMVWSMVGS